MKKLALVAVLALAAAACRGDSDGLGLGDAAVELGETAKLADALVYKAEYRYEQRGTLAEGVETRLQIVQRPPESLRRFQTTTTDAEGKTYTETSWYVSRRSDPQVETSELEFFTCYSGDFTTKGEVVCLTAPPTGVFGRRQIDEVFDFVRDPQEAFQTVSEGEGTEIAGEEASCYEAVHRSDSPEPTGSPEPFDPRTHKFQICYSQDGILLRLHRQIDEPVPTGQGSLESVMEATSVSRTVRASDLRLPGDVATPDELRGTPKP